MTYLSAEHLIIILPILILIEGFFSGAEIALLSTDKIHLKKLSKKGAFGSSQALYLATHPEKVLSTTLLITSLCVIGNSALVAIYFFQTDMPFAEFKAVALTSFLVVIFGELIPKTLYRKYADRIAPYIALPVQITYYLFFPVTRLLSLYNYTVTRLIKPIETLVTGKKANSREDLQDMLEISQKDSEIQTSEKRMIQRIFNFKDSESKTALIPLLNVDAIENSATIEDAMKSFEEHRHSRMPVYSERVDNMIGILNFFDLINVHNLSESVSKYVKPIPFVAENQKLPDVLSQLNEEKMEMAIVVDEHGGSVGIVTFEDIVEEVVGELEDEDDPHTENVRRMDHTTWIVSARTEIVELNESVKINLPQGDYETLSGFLLQQFGRIPENRDELYLQTDEGHFKFTIRHASDRHIESVIIEKLDV